MNDVSIFGNIKISINQCPSREEWNEYLAANTSSTIYHLPEWSRILQDSFGYEPLHLFAWSEDGKLCGILPLLLVKSALTGNHLVSLPFSHICGTLTDSQMACSALIRRAKNLCDSTKSRYLEIRSKSDEYSSNSILGCEQSALEIDRQFSTFILSLSDADTAWKALDSKSVRWAVRKARKDGVQIRKGDSIQDINKFYVLNLKTKRRIGVPGHPKNLFLNMFDKLPDKCTLYLASLQGKNIGGIITLKFKDTVIYGYGASDDEYRMHQPNSLLVWTAIEEACNDGYRYFDFGRTSPAEQNLTAFKKHWGTEEDILSYYYYPHTPNSMALNGTGKRYKLATGLWKKMPIPLTQFCSNRLFNHLG